MNTEGYQDLLDELRQLRRDNNILRSDREIYRDYAYSREATNDTLEKVIARLEETIKVLTKNNMDLKGKLSFYIDVVE